MKSFSLKIPFSYEIFYQRMAKISIEYFSQFLAANKILFI